MDRTQGIAKASVTCVLSASVTAALYGLAGSAVAATPSFVDVTAESGVTWTYGLAEDTGGARMHGGGAVADFNNDGWPDIFVIGGGLDNDRLYINQGDGTFTEEAAAWGLTDLYRGGGAAAGDYDDDGFIDLFVSSMGDMPDAKDGEHKLYRNMGDNTFVNVADAAGVAFNHTSNLTGTNTLSTATALLGVTTTSTAISTSGSVAGTAAAIPTTPTRPRCT
ncbi:MAG: VCBS repeat-containing protein [Pseudomonadota bacterium]